MFGAKPLSSPILHVFTETDQALMPFLLVSITVLSVLTQTRLSGAKTFQTRDARITIDQQGLVASIIERRSGKEYVVHGNPSALLSLHEAGTPYGQLIDPHSASFDRAKGQFHIQFPNGSSAVVKADAKPGYLRFKLLSLQNRGRVDNIVWGPIKTTVSKYIGDIIGVVQDDHWAIGLYGIDDNTIAGPPVVGDSHGLGYYVHSFDTAKWPLPPDLKEGQWFNLGGDGISDVAFSSHPDEYFQQIGGLGARLEPEFGSSIAYHSRDRRSSYTQSWSLLPGFPRSRPRTQVSDPVSGVDFIGSTVALYACPTDQGLTTLHNIVSAEGLPQPQIDGRWVHDPSLLKPDIAWNGGPHDKLIEYAEGLTLNAVQDEGQGEYYANPADHWLGKRVAFSGNRSTSYKDFTAACRKHGIKYGLHTLCLFLQPGRCTDVSPNASDHLQTVCRTSLAKDLSETDTDIVVTDPSFLAEKGTWPIGDDSNVIQIGGELVQYDGISTAEPWTLSRVKRGFGDTKAQAHRSGNPVVKLQQNCYGGFCPDMTLMVKYADYYAAVMAENGMEYIDFDGLESTLYMNQGYYGVRMFMRRFFETFAKLTGGRAPRVMGAGIMPGEWEFVGSCNVGGGNNMFDPIENHWGTEGKDVRHSFQNSFLPPTFGIQNWHSDWSLYDAENLEAKSVGWEATYMLGLTQEVVERSGEKSAIFKAYRAWENARAANLFTPAQKDELKDLSHKFHIEQTDQKSFILTPISELRAETTQSDGIVKLVNPNLLQPLHLAVRMSVEKKETSGAVQATLPDGTQIQASRPLKDGEFLIVEGDKAYQADHNRNKIADCVLTKPAFLPVGQAQFSVTGPAGARFQLVVWSLGKRENVGRL